MRVRGLPSAADWRALVFRHRADGLGNGVRVLLLYLADHMKADRTVSVPRSQIARDLGVSPRQVTERMQAAHEAGLLDTVRRGRPGTTAMYQGLFPSVSLGTPGVPKEEPQHGAGNLTISTPLLGTPGDPATSKRERTHAVGVGTTAGGSTVNAPRRPHQEEPRIDIAAPARSAGGETAEGGCGVSSADRATRRALIDAIQENVRTGMAWTAGDDDILDQFINDPLWDLLNELQDGLGDWAVNYWSFPNDCATNRYLAGKQLNMLVATYRSEAA